MCVCVCVWLAERALQVAFHFVLVAPHSSFSSLSRALVWLCAAQTSTTAKKKQQETNELSFSLSYSLLLALAIETELILFSSFFRKLLYKLKILLLLFSRYEVIASESKSEQQQQQQPTKKERVRPTKEEQEQVNELDSTRLDSTLEVRY